MKFIRDNVIFILIPNMNPDGTTLVANWYMKHVGTPFERSAPPELYHKYVGHDNNRDWFMFNQPETKNSALILYTEWYPQIIYNQHQSAPFPARIFVPPFDDPMNPNIPPIVMRGVNMVGDAITRRPHLRRTIRRRSRRRSPTGPRPSSRRRSIPVRFRAASGICATVATTWC